LRAALIIVVGIITARRDIWKQRAGYTNNE
jgi:hypothetical protein